MGSKRKFTRMQKNEIRRTLRKVEKKIKDIKAYKRLQVLRMYGQGIPNEDIKEATEYSLPQISHIVTIYLKDGIERVITDKRTSNNRRMSFSGEEKFLEQFIDLADAGQIVTVKEILTKFEETTGKPSNTTTIYQLLKRHGWRKVAPRPAHPGKASEEEINSSKKLTQNSGNCCWKKIEETSGINTNTTRA